MEKKSSKKKLLFILIPVLAVLAAGGLIVGLNAKNWFGPKETPPAETESAPADTEVEPSTEPEEDVVMLPVAYNLDFEYYSGMTEGGLSSRPKGEDGLFHIVVSIEGVQKELLTDKYSMVNVIDSREFSCIAYDEDNRITAVKKIEDCGYTLLLESGYLQKYDKEAGIIRANIDENMAGFAVTIPISKGIPVYDTMNKIDPAPEVEFNVGDHLGVLRYDPENRLEVVVFPARVPVLDRFYWNVERKWSSDIQNTTRLPNEDGEYVFTVYHNGEETTLKTKILELAKRIDSYAFKCFAARLDKDGYVVHVTRCQDALSGRSGASWHIVTSFDNEEKTVFTAKKYSGSDKGSVQTITMAENCRVFNCGGPFADHGGEYATVEIGDQVHCILNANGEAEAIFLVSRRIESRVYWNVSRQYDSETKSTKRTPDANGMYTYVMAVDGKQITLKAKNKEIADKIDSIAAKHMGLTLEGDVITAVHTTAGNKVRGYYGSAASWYNIEKFTDASGKEFTAKKYGTGSEAGNVVTLKVADGAAIYNVSSRHNSYVGEPTTLRVGDQIHCLLDSEGNASFIYVVNRYYQSKIYWNVTRKYNSTKKETTRTPNEEGYYEFLFAVDGKQVTLQTKDKSIANSIDGFAARAMGLQLAADGKTITKYIHYASVEGYTGGSSSSWCDVLSISGNKFTTQKLTDTSSSYYMQVFNETKASNCQTYNVSGFYDGSTEGHYVGEPTKMRVGDRVHVLTDRDKKTVIIYVVGRSYPVTAHKDKHTCYDCGKDVEWTPWTQASSLPLTTGHYYLCGNVTLTGQQNIEKDANVVLCLNGYTVTGADTARMFNGYGANARLTVIGEQKGSKVVAGKYQDPEGDIAGLIAYTRNADMAFYGGTYDASNVKTPANASAFFNASGHKMELHNVTVIGGEAGKFGGVLSVNNGSEVLLDNVTFKGGKGNSRNEVVGVSNGTLRLKGKITFEGLEDGVTGMFFNGGKATLEGLTGGSIPVKAVLAGAFTTNYEEGAEKYFTSTDPAFVVGMGDGTALVLASGPATAVTYEEASISLRKQQEKKAVFTVTPADAATTALIYESSDPSIVSVDENGLLKAGTTEGTATLTVKTKDGAASTTVTVTVAGDPVAVTGITPSKSTIDLSVGATETIEYTLSPAEASYQKLQFASDNEAIATVDKNGAVKAVAAGTTVIRLTPELGDATASVTVNVTKHEHCVCGDGALTADGHSHAAVDWLPWTATDSLPTGEDANGKAYYLTSNVTISKAQALNGVSVTLCLNGYTVTSTAAKTYNLTNGAALNLTDCKGSGAIKVSGSFTSGAVAGGIVSTVESTLNIYGGTLDASGLTTTYGGAIYSDPGSAVNLYNGTVIGGHTSGAGGAIYLSTGVVMKMYGGTVSGGETDTTGGNIYVANSNCLFYGGTVTGGKAKTYGGNLYLNRGDTELLGTLFENGNARSGGNVYLSANSTLTIDGSTVTGGKATQSGSSGGIGGNICTNGLTTLKSGTVSNGQNFGSQPGGNIGVWDTGSKLVMTGGTISGGKSEGSSAAGGVGVFYHAAEGAFVMTGGTITGNEGGVYVRSGDITISGDAVIDGNTGTNLSAGGSAIKLGGALTTGASIGVSVSAADTFAASETDYSSFFKSDDDKYNVVWDSEAKAHKLQKDNSSVKLDIYILAGQSNANGSSTFESAKEGERDGNSYGNVIYYTLRNYVDGSRGDYHPDYQPVKEGLGSSGTTIGPELGMAQVLNPLYEGDDKQALILKYAAGGTSLVRYKQDDSTLNPAASGSSLDMFNQKGSWYPTELESAQSVAEGENRCTGFLYRGLLNSIETVYNELLTMGYKAENITFKTFDWMQGESDREYTTQYKAVFPTFIKGVRDKVSAVTGQDYSKLPVVIGEISETFGAGTPERIAVCRAFIAMQNSLPGIVSDATVIPTSQFQMNGYDEGGNAVVLGADGSHWSYGDEIKVGRMFAEATVGASTPETPHTHCICGTGTVTANAHAHETLTWQKWSYAYGLPTSAGNWYLTTDVSLTGTLSYDGVTGVNICLNGHTVTANCNRPIFVKGASSLTMTNCSAEGKYENVMTAALANGGGLFSIDGGSTVSVYNMLLDASKVSCKYGSAVYMNARTDALNIYNSEVIGGNGTVTGGTMYIAGALTVYDSVIRDGKSPEGGNLYVTGNATATLGGTTKVTGGTATTGGGNISAAGTSRKLILKDQVQILNGTANGDSGNRTGGNLYVRGSSQTTIQDDVLIKGGTSYGMGGNICVVKDSTAKVTMTGGTVTEGVSINSGGGNVVVYQGGSFTMTGGTVSKGWSKSNGYNFRIGGNFTLSGGTITTRGVYNGTTTSNNSVSTNDGSAPVITMTGGYIAENLQSVKDTAVVTVKGGRIGGNVNSNTGTIQIQGGYVGGTLSKSTGTLTIAGGYFVKDPTAFIGTGRTVTPGTYTNTGDTTDTTSYLYKVE